MIPNIDLAGVAGGELWYEVLRLPPRELSPNARHHWGRLVKPRREWKEAGWLAGQAMRRVGVFHQTGFEAWRPALLTYRFFVPDRRKRDLDNLVAAMKPFTDGLVASGLLADDSAEHLRFGKHGMTYFKGKSAVMVYLGDGR